MSTITQVIIDGSFYAAKVPTTPRDPDSGKPDRVLSVQAHLKECVLMSKIGNHENIIKFMGVCYLPGYPGLPAMVMEKVSTCNLHEYLDEVGPMNNVELKRKRMILLGVANGLHYLHSDCESRPAIVHMDLKATIILMTSSYHPKIAGFRKSCLVTDAIKAADSRYDPEYMPPEVIKDVETICNPKIDIFSFGVLALFTLNQVRNMCDYTVFDHRYRHSHCSHHFNQAHTAPQLSLCVHCGT